VKDSAIVDVCAGLLFVMASFPFRDREDGWV